VLISRTESKLQAVAADLESRFSVQTKVVPADFATATEDTWEAISAVVSSVPVGVLINSAGVSYDHAGEHSDLATDVSCPFQRPGHAVHKIEASEAPSK
jgi:short-subunit dehydrogenase